MPSNFKRAAIAMTGASMLAFGGAGSADAAKTTKRHSTAQNTSGRGAEAELSGDTAQSDGGGPNGTAGSYQSDSSHPAVTAT